MTKLVNADIFYDLDYCSRNPLNNFILQNCLFGVTNIGKNNDKSKNVYTSYGLAFEGAGSWSFSNGQDH